MHNHTFRRWWTGSAPKCRNAHIWSDTWDSVEVPTYKEMRRCTLLRIWVDLCRTCLLPMSSVCDIAPKWNIIFDCMQPCSTTQDQGKDVNWAETFVKVISVHLLVRFTTCIQAIEKLQIQLAEVSCRKIISPTSVGFWYITNSGVQTYPVVWLTPEFSCASRFSVWIQLEGLFSGAILSLLIDRSWHSMALPRQLYSRKYSDVPWVSNAWLLDRFGIACCCRAKKQWKTQIEI